MAVHHEVSLGSNPSMSIMCMYLECEAAPTVAVQFEGSDEVAKFCDQHLEDALKADRLGFVAIVSTMVLSPSNSK
jgi:hypothetical protein